MFFLRIPIVLIAAVFSTSLLAATPETAATHEMAASHECTYLDKSYWIPIETFKSKLSKRGRKVVDFQVVGSCYQAVVLDKDGREYEGYYDPASGHPLQRQLKK